MSKINVTKKPIFAIEKQKKGNKFKATYTVEINGEEFTSSVESNVSDSDAFLKLKNKSDQALKNSKYAEQFAGKEIDDVLGYPKKTDPSEILQRKQTAKPVEEDTASQAKKDNLTPLSKRPTQPSVDSLDKSPMVKGEPRNHLPFKENLFGTPYDGREDKELHEPIPEPFERPGDEIIKSKTSNAQIQLGRDFAPSNKIKNSKSIFDREYNSRFSDHMGAGAIDIVVGRMAPFALENIDGETITLGPSFNTSRPPELLTKELTGGLHPGYCMDAARIYISQMTLMDNDFNITTKIRGSHKEVKEAAPTSGIMLKADILRMHSRQDIKIVTGGPRETVNSQGNLLSINRGVHIIAENGISKEGKELPQHPMVLGDNLLECLIAMQDLIKQVNDRVDAFLSQQMSFNAAVGHGFDMLPIPYAISMRDARSQWTTMATTIQLAIGRVQGLLIDVNNFTKQTNYLIDGNEKFINSRHNTVN